MSHEVSHGDIAGLLSASLPVAVVIALIAAIGVVALLKIFVSLKSGMREFLDVANNEEILKRLDEHEAECKQDRARVGEQLRNIEADIAETKILIERRSDAAAKAREEMSRRISAIEHEIAGVKKSQSRAAPRRRKDSGE